MGVMSDPLTNDLFAPALLPIRLQGPADLEGFRRAARNLLAQHILPSQISWHTSDAPESGLLAGRAEAVFDDAPPVQVPSEFMALCESVILHKEPQRFALLYRLLWRLVHEPGVRHNPLDADMAEAQRMAQAVRRDIHNIKAFVRFRSVQDDTFRNHPESGPLHVAWYEPEHHIMEAVAPFFAKRFAQMRWALLTTEASAQWDGAQLQFGPGACKEDVPTPDASEQRWLHCYQHFFQPARLKVRAVHTKPARKSRRRSAEAAPGHALAPVAHLRKRRTPVQSGTWLERRTSSTQARTAVPAPTESMQALLALDDSPQLGIWPS